MTTNGHGITDEDRATISECNTFTRLLRTGAMVDGPSHLPEKIGRLSELGKLEARSSLHELNAVITNLFQSHQTGRVQMLSGRPIGMTEMAHLTSISAEIERILPPPAPPIPSRARDTHGEPGDNAAMACGCLVAIVVLAVTGFGISRIPNKSLLSVITPWLYALALFISAVIGIAFGQGVVGKFINRRARSKKAQETRQTHANQQIHPIAGKPGSG